MTLLNFGCVGCWLTSRIFADMEPTPPPDPDVRGQHPRPDTASGSPNRVQWWPPLPAGFTP